MFMKKWGRTHDTNTHMKKEKLEEVSKNNCYMQTLLGIVGIGMQLNVIMY